MKMPAMFRQFTSLALAGLLLFGCVTPAFALEAEGDNSGAAKQEIRTESSLDLSGWEEAGLQPRPLTSQEAAGAIEVSDEASLRAAVFSGSNRVVVKLTKDITLENALVLNHDIDLVMHSADGNTKTITQTAPKSQTTLTRHFEVRAVVSITLSNITLKGDTDRGNGGIHVYSGHALTLDGCGTSEITSVGGFSYGGLLRIQRATEARVGNIKLSNSTVGAQGGGILIEDTPMVSLDRLAVTQNASPIGGGLYISGVETDVTIRDSVIEGNQATGTGAGGGIYVTNSKVTVERSQISGNTTNAGGGGLYANREAAITITETSFSGNTAHSGAGLYITPSVQNDSNLVVTGSSFTDNLASLGGGAMYLLHCDVELTGSLLQGNGARMAGGGLYLWHSDLILDRSEILDNQAAYSLYPDVVTQGGGIYLIEDAHVLLKHDSVIAGNFASIGGGVGVSERSHWSNISAEADGRVFFRDNTASYYATVITEEDKTAHAGNFPGDTLKSLSTFTYQVNQGGDTETVTVPFVYAYNNYDIAYPNSNNISYRVTYVVDGQRDLIVDANRYIQGTLATVVAEEPQKEGHTFLGWSASMTATQPEYVANQPLNQPMNGNVTLYAVWKEAVTVTFHPNGGKGEAVIFTVGVDHNIAPPTSYYQMGYDIAGWYEERIVPAERSDIDYRTYEGAVVDQQGNPAIWGTNYGDGRSLDGLTESIVLYARWEEDAFQIKPEQAAYLSMENQMKIALSSVREQIRINLYDDVYLSDAMRATRLSGAGLIEVTIQNCKGNGSPAEIIQRAQEQHFYILNASTNIKLTLNGIRIRSESGHGGISVSNGSLHLIGQNGSGFYGIDKTGEENLVRSSAINGGAIKVIQGSAVIEDLIFDGNKVNNYGGAIYIDSSEVTIQNCHFTNHEAKNGGAIALRSTKGDSLVTINGGSLAGNRAALNGGAIYVMDNAFYEQLTVGGTAFSGNEADSYITHPTKEEIEVHDRNITVSQLSQLPGGAATSYAYNNYDISGLGESYSVTYHANGADDPPVDHNRYAYGAEAVIKGQGSMEWEYHDFLGWVTREDETAYVSGPVKMEQDLHLYADWELKQYTVTYYDQDGNRISGAEERVLAFGHATQPTVTPNPGTYLTHWEDMDTGNRFSFSQEILKDTNLQVFADIIPIQGYLICFDTGDGSAILPLVAEETDLFEDLFDANDVGTFLDYHTFRGWALDATGTTRLDETARVDAYPLYTTTEAPFEVLTLYAIWELDQYEVTWMDGEGKEKYVDDATHENWLQHPELRWREDAVFDGWYRHATDEELLPIPSPFLVFEDTTLYAHWDTISYTVEIRDGAYRYDRDIQQSGGEDVEGTDYVVLERFRVDYGSPLSEAYAQVEKEGYEFSYYETMDGTKWEEGTEVRNPENGHLILYAIFERDSYIISFYKKLTDTTVYGTLQNVAHGTTYSAFPEEITTPERDCYQFAYWGLDTGLSVEGLFTMYPIVKNWSIYAFWTYRPEVKATFEYAPALEAVTVFENNEVILNALPGIDENDQTLGIPTYQWYYADAEGSLGVAVPEAAGGTAQKLQAFTDTPGSYYYYVVMKHGDAAATSNHLKVTVEHRMEADFYTVDYHLNGGDGILVTMPAVYGVGSAIYLADAGLISRNGYSFGGWGLTKSGSVIGDGGTVRTFDEAMASSAVHNTVTLYAIWKSDHTGGGSGGGAGTVVLTIEGHDEAGAKLYEATQRHAAGAQVTVQASVIDGYTLNDEKEKTIVISSTASENLLIFHYTTDSGTYPPLERALHMTYLSGYPDQSVGPDRNITRAEVAMIFYRLIKEEARSGSYACRFEDVSSDKWYYDAVAYLSANKVLEGYLDGTFGPDRTITRAEFSVIASRFAALQTGSQSFTDVSGHWAQAHITNGVARGWLEGYEDGSFRPDAYITRGEAVTVINRMLDRGLALEDVPAGVNPYRDLSEDHWAYTGIIEASIPHDYERREDGTERWK